MGKFKFTVKQNFLLFVALVYFFASQSFANSQNGPRLTQYKIEEVKKNLFHIKNDTKFLSLEIVPGDGSLIKINEEPFSLELEKTRRHNEKLVAKRLEHIFYFKENEREISKSSWLNQILPQAQASEWIAEGNGSDGLARIVLSIVYMHRNQIKKSTNILEGGDAI